ncbi:hypothetical protein [Pseudomonas putida]|jgi:hypothetical protein|uniref:hypothetical protein n=1 Tax=Pseudomonas putida TaxID=303 RepID=UPI001E60693D|nr:hypothetical protein [Pseudomonas putida]
MKAQVLEKSAGRPKTCRTWKKVQALQVLLAGLLLAGCAARPAAEVRYVRVEVPVQVPCRAPDVAIPPWAAAGLRRTDSLEVKVRALLAERRQRIGYEKQLEAAVSACR